jgi:hypothetical protein
LRPLHAPRGARAGDPWPDHSSRAAGGPYDPDRHGGRDRASGERARRQPGPARQQPHRGEYRRWELGGKRLDLRTQVVPRASRVAVLWNAALADKVLEWQGVQTAARALRVMLHSLEVRTPDDFDGVLGALAQEHPNALITLDETIILAYNRRIVAFAMQHRMAMMSEVRDFAEAGDLMTYKLSGRDL